MQFGQLLFSGLFIFRGVVHGLAGINVTQVERVLHFLCLVVQTEVCVHRYSFLIVFNGNVIIFVKFLSRGKTYQGSRMFLALRLFFDIIVKNKFVLILCCRIVFHGRENIAHPLVALSQIALCCVRVVLLIKGNHFFVITQRFLILLAEIHPHRSFIHQLEICLLLSFCLLLGLSRHVIIFS